MMCLSMDFFGFVLLGFTQFLEVCGFISFAIFGKLSTIISLNTVLAPLTFSFPGAVVVQMLDLLSFSHRSLIYFFSISSICCSDWVNSVYLSSSSLILSSVVSILLLRPSSDF